MAEVKHLQGEDLLARRWNATLELTIRDNRTGRTVTRAVSQDEVWENRDYLNENALALAGLVADRLDRVCSPGVGITEANDG